MWVVLLGLSCRAASPEAACSADTCARDDGVAVYFVRPSREERVRSPVKFEVEIRVTEGAGADVVRQEPSEWRFCWSVGPNSGCHATERSGLMAAFLSEGAHTVRGWLEHDRHGTLGARESPFVVVDSASRRHARTLATSESTWCDALRASVSDAPSSRPRPSRRADVVVWQVQNPDYLSGFGHELKDAASALIIGEIFGWTVARPRGFERRVLAHANVTLDSLVDLTFLGSDAACPSSWAQLEIDRGQPLFDGVEDLETLVHELCAPVLTSPRRDGPGVCVRLTHSFRVHMYQLHQWEAQGRVREGAYRAVQARLENAVRARSPVRATSAIDDSVVRIVVHFRRDDLAKESALIQPMAQIVKLMGFIDTQLDTIQRRFTLVTGPEHNEDVFSFGCDGLAAPCEVVSESVREDFATMLDADILVVASSSLSTWAATLGKAKLVLNLPWTKAFYPCPNASGASDGHTIARVLCAVRTVTHRWAPGEGNTVVWALDESAIARALVRWVLPASRAVSPIHFEFESPSAEEVVSGALAVSVALHFADGEDADRVRAAPSSWSVCFALAWERRCVALNGGSFAAISVAPWAGYRVALSGWLERNDSERIFGATRFFQVAGAEGAPTAGAGLGFRFASPPKRAVTGTLYVSALLNITQGDAADRVRSVPSSWRACYGVVWEWHCVPLNGEGLFRAVSVAPWAGRWLALSGWLASSATDERIHGTTAPLVASPARDRAEARASVWFAAGGTSLIPISEDGVVDSACDFGYHLRNLHSLYSGAQVKAPAVICAMGDGATLKQLFEEVVPNMTSKKFTLVTLEHDDRVPPVRAYLDEPRLVSWHGWNIAADHPKLHALPIGLNRGRHLRAIRKYMGRRAEKNGRVLVNFKLDRQDRIALWELSASWDVFADRVSYDAALVAPRLGVLGAETKDAFYTLLSNYSFVVCPRGAGLDTHRVWEALYLGVVPIVLSSPSTAAYKGLPVVQLDQWEDLTEERLASASALSAAGWDSGTFESLDLMYWTQRIARSGVRPIRPVLPCAFAGSLNVRVSWTSLAVPLNLEGFDSQHQLAAAIHAIALPICERYKSQHALSEPACAVEFKDAALAEIRAHC